MDKTEKRTAEEILNALEKSDSDKHFPSYTYEEDYAGGTCRYHRSDLVKRAMHEYAAQELTDYKAVIEELLPMADHWYDYLKCFENWAKDDNPPPEWFYKLPEYKENIDRARKLINL